MSELLEDLFGADHRVHRLAPEQFFNELRRQHAFDDVLKHLLGPVFADVLGAESLLKDVDHFSA